MAFKLERKRTGSTPYVLIDEDNHYMKMEGESFHEDAVGFFKEINAWLADYLATDFDLFTFECKFEYFNSSTAKILLNMFYTMDERASQDKQIVVNWFAVENDDIIIECGEGYKEDMKNVRFNMVVGG